MRKWNSYREATEWFDNYFNPTARIVAGDVYRWEHDPATGRNEYVQTYAGRAWFTREYRAHRLHPAVYELMQEYFLAGWQQLLLEWPHKSSTDPNRLAYTRDERAGEADRQVVTTIGKYLTRHFVGVPDNVIRDIVAKHTYGGSIELTHNLERMIEAVSSGPSSCMTRDFGIKCDDGQRRHPYAVYDPSLGWGMAIRTEGDEVLGRCLVWTDPDDESNRGFVRSYKRERGYSSHTGRDEAIDVYLTSLGFTRWSEWQDDTPLMEYSLSGGGYLMPYIDGGTQTVDKDSFTIHCNGDLQCSNTNGITNCHDHECEDCGAGFNDGDGYWVGRHEDRHICDSCCDDNYTYVYGRNGHQYYVHNDNYVCVGDEYYDVDYLSDNNIVELANGDYADIDDAVYVESADAYYPCDDDDVCYAEDSGRHELTEDCWRCAESGNWYTDDTDCVEVDGEKYHPDNAPETNDEETN